MPAHNFRQNGSWTQGTPYKRENGSWVEVGNETAASAIPDRFYTDGPPTRNGDTITYPADGHSSIQAAVDSLSSGDTLYIEPGTYQEQVSLDATVANHITIESDLELSFDSNNVATVAQEGAVIQMPDESYGFRIENEWLNNDGTFYGTYNDPGVMWDYADDTSAFPSVIEVDSHDAFSVGDVIMFEEARAPYGLSGGSGGANHADNTAELRVIESFPSSTEVELDVPLFLPYPDSASRRIGTMDWSMRDIVVRGIEIEATGDDPSTNPDPMPIYSTRDGWFEDIYIHSAGGNPMVSNTRTFNLRFNRMMFEHSDRYGIQNSTMANRTLVTNAYSNDIRRYVTMWGGGSTNSCDGYAAHINGTNMRTRAAVDVHFDGFHISFRDIIADDAVVASLRSKYIDLRNFEGSGVAGTHGEFIEFRQRPEAVTVRDGTIHSVTDDTDQLISIGLRSADDASSNATMPEYFDRISVENVDVEEYGTSLANLGQWVGDQEGDSITFSNITYGGQQLTTSDVQSWDGWSNVTVNDLTVE